MKFTFPTLFMSAFSVLLVTNAFAQFEYVSPLPDSKFHNPSTNIILRNGDELDESTLHAKNLFKVTGSESGLHDYKIRLADEGKSILIKPVTAFAEGEQVSVTIGEGILKTDGGKVDGMSFHFYIHPHRSPEIQKTLNDALKQVHDEEFGPEATSELREEQSGFPPFTIVTNTTTSPGDVLFHNFNFVGIKDSHYCIIKNNGDSVYGKYDTVTFNNFALNHNGYFTVYNKNDSVFSVLDSNYNQVKVVQMGNGYKADVHELQMYPDRTFLLCYDVQPFDMTIYDPTYPSNATVIGCVLQELDADQNVIFQWRSWDHFEVTDATHQSFYNLVIDYVHGNSIELDNDGNLLLSCRHMDEITKININTGNIMWRMGGKHNEFTFTNDPDKFYYQHDVRRLPNGDITVFDNGNFYSPPRSSAKEYSLDEITKKATLTWSYARIIAGQNIFGSAMGSVQRLENGNTFICWGLLQGISFPNITEVDANNHVVWEFKLGTNDAIYRASRREWTPCSRPTSTLLKVKNITGTSAGISWTSATNAVSYNLEYKKKSGGAWIDINTHALNKKLTGLLPSTVYKVRLRSICSQPNGGSSDWTTTKQFTTKPQRTALTNDQDLISFEIYPNPSAGLVQLHYDGNGANVVHINIYDIAGRMVYSTKGEDGSQILQLDLHELTTGLYFAEVETGGVKLREELVIQ